MLPNLTELLDQIIVLSKEAGDVIMPFFESPDQLDIKRKEDNTPLTEADLQSHETIQAALEKLTPDLPILSEEGDIPAYSKRRLWERYWLIDPLDGTRGFVDHSTEFTVNIALIEQHRPILGVIYAPAKDLYYYACRDHGAFKRENEQDPIRLQTTPLNWARPRVVLGKFHGLRRFTNLKHHLGEIELIRLNSSLKFGCLAEGDGDFYPRFGPINEWDTAAGQCILEEAGGAVVDFTGQSLQYNAEASLLNPEFVAVGDPSQLDKLLDIFSIIRRQS